MMKKGNFNYVSKSIQTSKIHIPGFDDDEDDSKDSFGKPSSPAPASQKPASAPSPAPAVKSEPSPVRTEPPAAAVRPSAPAPAASFSSSVSAPSPVPAVKSAPAPEATPAPEPTPVVTEEPELPPYRPAQPSPIPPYVTPLQTPPQREERKGGMDDSFKAALEKRKDEFLKTRRDVMSRLTEALSIFEDDEKLHRTKADDLDKAQVVFKDLYNKVERIYEAAWDENNYSAELAESMKTVENARLEYLKTYARLERGGEKAAVSQTSDNGKNSFIHELNSLSFKQLAKLGFFLFFPVVVAMGVCSFLIMLAIVLSMRF